MRISENIEESISQEETKTRLIFRTFRFYVPHLKNGGFGVIFKNNHLYDTKIRFENLK